MKLLLGGGVLAGVLLGGAGVWFATRAAPGDLAATDRVRIERVVRDTILAYPEIIPEAVQRLQDRETGKQVAANRAAIVEPFGSAFAGNPKGDVTVVEYYDYNCGYCRASLPTIARLIESDAGIRVVFRELPVLSEESRTAARLSLAAAEQGRFTAFNAALYAGGRVSPATMAAAAARAGVDTARAAQGNARYEAEIARNLQVAAGLGVTGTPSWVVGDRVLVGAQPLEKLREAIALARGK